MSRVLTVSSVKKAPKELAPSLPVSLSPYFGSNTVRVKTAL
jgi:hypothetical protein